MKSMVYNIAYLSVLRLIIIIQTLCTICRIRMSWHFRMQPLFT